MIVFINIYIVVMEVKYDFKQWLKNTRKEELESVILNNSNLYLQKCISAFIDTLKTKNEAYDVLISFSEYRQDERLVIGKYIGRRYVFQTVAVGDTADASVINERINAIVYNMVNYETLEINSNFKFVVF